MTLLHHVEDPRQGWELFRRSMLWHVLKQEGIKLPVQDPSKEQMLPFLKDVNPAKYRHLLVRDALNGNMNQRVEINVPQEPKPVDLNTLNVPSLRKIAKEKGIKFEMTTKKKELIALINGNAS